MNKRNLIIVLIVLLAVGFAAVSTTLFINGTVMFGTNEEEFTVIFTKAIVDDVDLSDTAISEDGQTITYETKELAIIGEESILDFTVKNNSTQYDAEININCIGGANEGNYYELEYDLPTFVEAQSEIDGYVKTRMIRSSVNEIIEELTCTLDVTAMERTEIAEGNTNGIQGEITWSDENNDGIRSLGDIVTISKEGASIEQFYIISSDETNTVMLSMYNLYVGGEYDGTTWTAYTNPTGIQDSSMIGANSEGTPYRGIVAFSSDSQKGTNYSDYSGSIVEVYVNNYSNYLRNTLGIENSATLISKEEIGEMAGSTLSSDINLSTLEVPDWLYSTGYWTRTAYDSTYVFTVATSSRFVYGNSTYSRYLGVRPVVTIDSKLFADEQQYIVCEGICSNQDENRTITIGDIITLGDETSASKEQFYVTSISEDLSSVSMLSMYNLYVGGEYTGSWTAYTNPTGIQNSTMIGSNSGGTPYRGIVAFSSDSQKGTNYSDYSGSLAEVYVNNYSDYLRNTLGVENSATLISKEDIEAIVGSTLPVDINLSTLGAPTWLYGTSYWTRTAHDFTYVFTVATSSRFVYGNSTYGRYLGVRPLVTISADLI